MQVSKSLFNPGLWLLNDCSCLINDKKTLVATGRETMNHGYRRVHVAGYWYAAPNPDFAGDFAGFQNNAAVGIRQLREL